MSEKYLPIKIFEKRKEIDDRDTEGSGNNNTYGWILRGEQLLQRSRILSTNITDLKSTFRSRKAQTKYQLPLIMTMSVIPDAIAKSHRRAIVDVLENDNNNNVIGFYSKDTVLAQVGTEQLLNNMQTIFSSPDTNAYIISAIEEMGLFRPYIKKSENLSDPYKVKLLDYNDYDLNNMARIIFEQNCKASNITINKKTKYSSDLIIYDVTLDSAKQLEDLEDFEGLFSIEPMPFYEITLDTLPEENNIPEKQPLDEEVYPIVGVLDSGISPNKYLEPWLDTESHTNYPVDYVNTNHGTFVSGIILYGDELNHGQTTECLGVKLFDATVYPDPNKCRIYQDELVEHIREAIETNSDRIKIWNLSLGTRIEADIDSFSDFGIALDSIQDENNVLIIKSAGNCTNFVNNLPKSRIAQSADSVRSVVVGSITDKKEDSDMADVNMPSPFTRVGPGPSYIVKPDLVHIGGNAGTNTGKLIKHGVPSILPNGKISHDCGTSFSTPRVTRIASELLYSMDEEFDPLMLKALMIHAAQYPNDIDLSMAERIRQMGYGVPPKANDILYNSPNEISLVLRDTLQHHNFIEIFDFPFPKTMIDARGFFRGQIILTLVNNPILDYKQSAEYCQSNLEIGFGTYQNEVSRDVTKATIKNPIGRDDSSKNILNQSCYSRRVLNKHTGDMFGKERFLTQYGLKFHPVKKYAIDLGDMTPANKEQWLAGNRKWYLKITGLYRDFIERESVLNGIDLFQDFCMILTIRDPEGKCQVYDEVTQLLNMNNFIHHNIQLRGQIYYPGSL
ncbi:MAG: S8 family peptidase [Bacillota bacterium]|nr:S8 family peptidase [Bacillota bacterium]